MKAHLSADLTSIELYPLSASQCKDLYPDTLFVDEPSDETLADWPRLVIVRETTPPVVEYGSVLTELTPAKLGDGHWHQQWQVTAPDAARIAELKAETKELDRNVAESKMEPP